jgi:Peptidase A4 family
MRSHSYAYRGLIGCLALFTLGPMQLGKVQRIADDSHLSDGQGAFQSSHAPVKLRAEPNGLVIHGPRNMSTSFNWAGYAIKSGTYKSASLSWTVPTVSYVNYPGAPTFEDSSTWVGIGGFGSSDLIQLGTEQKVDSTGSTTYQAWYELFPAPETVLSPQQYPVSPGDAMSASLTCPNCTINVANTWTLSMTNSTKGWNWSQDFTYKSALGSADYVMEAPTFPSLVGIVALPNFGTVNFTNVAVNGQPAELASITDGLQLHDQAGG